MPVRTRGVLVMMTAAICARRLAALAMLHTTRRGRQPDVVPGANVIGIPLAIPAAVKVRHAIRLRRIKLRIGAQQPVERNAVSLGDTPERIAVLCGDRLIVTALCIPSMRRLAIRFGVANAFLKIGG